MHMILLRKRICDVLWLTPHYFTPRNVHNMPCAQIFRGHVYNKSQTCCYQMCSYIYRYCGQEESDVLISNVQDRWSLIFTVLRTSSALVCHPTRSSIGSSCTLTRDFQVNVIHCHVSTRVRVGCLSTPPAPQELSIYWRFIGRDL